MCYYLRMGAVIHIYFILHTVNLKQNFNFVSVICRSPSNKDLGVRSLYVWLAVKIYRKVYFSMCFFRIASNNFLNPTHYVRQLVTGNTGNLCQELGLFHFF